LVDHLVALGAQRPDLWEVQMQRGVLELVVQRDECGRQGR
jgi:hypothetical protein